MKTLYNKLHIFGQTMLLVFFTLSVLSLSSCSKETLDYNHPDVDLFVKQLKAGKYSTQSPDGLSNMPKFTSEDIEELLKYAEDLTVIPSFPLAPVSYSAGGKLRLGECILWTVETIRLGNNASMGCKMVHTDAENYEGIYFLSTKRCWMPLRATAAGGKPVSIHGLCGRLIPAMTNRFVAADICGGEMFLGIK